MMKYLCLFLLFLIICSSCNTAEEECSRFKESYNLSHLDSLKEVTLNYNIDSIYVVKGSITTQLPQEEQQILKRNNGEKRRYYWYGAIVLLIVVGAGLLVYKIKNP